MTTLLSFKLSKILKEKGFDKKCFYNYLNGKLNNEHPFLFNHSARSHQSQEFISAPTIAEVLMWLYNKHSIWINVDVEQYSDGNNWLFQIVDLSDKDDFSLVYGDDGEYNSLEEAYEAAINYVLTKLI